MDIPLEQQQQLICKKFGAEFTLASLAMNSGIAVGTYIEKPINGLRHSPTSDTTGWYIWGGKYSEADDFFSPVHTVHLADTLPQVLPFLGLPPGYRFLIDGDHKDVWFDPQLLNA